MCTYDKIKCKTCTKPFNPKYRNGILVSRFCPSCQYKKAYKKPSKSTFYFPKQSVKKTSSDKAKSMARADRWFSRYIRLKHSFEQNGEQFCKCYTCSSIKGIKNIDNGHYYGRGNKSTRYDEDNCRPQCKKCNRFKSGMHLQFGDKLLKELGKDKFEALRLLALERGEDNILYFNVIAEHYKSKCKKLADETI